MNEVNIEDIVLIEEILKEILKLDSCRGYILIKESDIYIPSGFKAVGYDFKIVSRDLTPDKITEEDIDARKENLQKHTYSPFIKYSNDEPLFTDAKVYQFLLLSLAKHLFMMDNQGGVVKTVEETDFLKRIKTATITAVSSERLKEIESKQDNY
jgi:hypothetical protein